MNKREIGEEYENKACELLLSKGYSILEKNYYTRFGEIDIVALKDRTLIFVEVKYRSSNRYGYGIEAIGNTKRNHMIKSAEVYTLKNQKYRNFSCQFDVICFDLDKTTNDFIITHYENVIN